MPRRPSLILFTLWLLVFAAAGQIIVIAPILPRIGEQLGVGPGPLGLLITVYSVTLAVFTLVVGPVSDRFGRRRVILIGTASMAGALLLHGLADSFETLLGLRVLAGAAGGVLSGASVAYVGDTFPADRRGWANGWVMSGFAVGQIIGIPLGIAMAGAFGFRAPFVGFGLAMVAAFVLAVPFLPQPAGATSRTPLTLRGALRGYASLATNRETGSAAGVYLLMFAGVGLFVVYFPTWLEVALGFGAREVSAVYILGGIANVLSGPRAGRLSDRIGRKPVIVAASAGVGVLMMATPLARAAPVSVYLVFFGIMALAASRVSPLQALLTEMVPAERRGSFMSMTAATGNAGFAVGAALAGVLYAGIGFGANAVIGGAGALVAAAMVWALLPTLREPDSPCPPDLEDCAGRPVPT
ncbi:MFS transporter, partial [Rubrivirga sp.]|uniref:MFS transporter n=1 Tax=Rubrivirga sp. TaxID=1885344 RepID=UPI003C750A2C